MGCCSCLKAFADNRVVNYLYLYGYVIWCATVSCGIMLLTPLCTLLCDNHLLVNYLCISCRHRVIKNVGGENRGGTPLVQLTARTYIRHPCILLVILRAALKQKRKLEEGLDLVCCKKSLGMTSFSQKKAPTCF